MSANILLVDDDRELCALLSEFLQQDGFVVAAQYDGVDALKHLAQRSYDVIVLDIMLPGMQGLDVLRELRQFCATPVIMLTAKGEDTDRIVGLELGADDYLPKPCNPRELAARLRAILRRAKGPPAAPSPTLQVGKLTVDTSERTAFYDTVPLSLTSAEFNLLHTLMAQAGQVVSKEELSDKALGRPLTAYDRSIDVHLSKLRKKLAALGVENPFLNVRGQGYQLKPGVGTL